MRRALLVSPHFPPDTTAATHRLRLIAPYLRQFGWEPTILTVDPGDYEGRLDPDLEALVPKDLRVVRARAWSPRWTRKLGIGDLGLRSYWGLRRAAFDLLQREKFDAFFVTIHPTYTAMLGRAVKRRFGTPFVLDYMDPWVGAWGRTVGGGEGGKADLKSRLTRRLGEWLEPKALSAADAVTAVSAGTYEQFWARNPTLSQTPSFEIPLGGDARDFEAARRNNRPNPYFDPSDGKCHICYVGTILPLGFETLRAVLGAVAELRDGQPEIYAQLRLHFFGSSNQTRADARQRVLPIAQEFGVDEIVQEVAPRIDYLDAVRVQTQASVLLLMGSSESHYTASKLYPALLSRRPLLAVYHSASTVSAILAKKSGSSTTSLITYDENDRAESRRAEIATALTEIVRSRGYDGNVMEFAAISEFSAQSMAARLAEVFNLVAERRIAAANPLCPARNP